MPGCRFSQVALLDFCFFPYSRYTLKSSGHHRILSAVGNRTPRTTPITGTGLHIHLEAIDTLVYFTYWPARNYPPPNLLPPDLLPLDLLPPD